MCQVIQKPFQTKIATSIYRYGIRLALRGPPSREGKGGTSGRTADNGRGENVDEGQGRLTAKPNRCTKGTELKGSTING